uniref:Laminin EGF-like domain-containing protein n=1 Tax=Caenorhabditis japonica TaxID=281687 RepID=A0A8R1DET8_CAEJA
MTLTRKYYTMCIEYSKSGASSTTSPPTIQKQSVEMAAFSPEAYPAEKCGNKGEWKTDRCECFDHYFGSQCQYTSKCVEGFLRNGRCICNDGFEGDCCDEIVCVYGTPDYKNRTLSCHCPEKYTGRRCDQCRKQGPLLEPFPDCELDPSKKKHIEKAAMLRQKVKAGIRKRLRIIALCVAALSLVGIIVCFGRVVHRKARTALELRNREDTAERHRLLTNHVRLQKFEETVAQEQAAARIEDRTRRKSEPAVLKLAVKKESSIKLDTSSSVRRKDTK